jgi:thiol-disulfide isomerase/thioredoxin
MDRLLVTACVAAAVAALVAGGRLVVRRRLRRLRAAGPEALWAALGTEPDGRPTVVAFATPSCTVCRTAQKPALAALEGQAAGAVRVIQVDASDRPEVARAFGILTVPATVVLDGRGAVVAANQGFATAERLAVQAGAG